MGVVSIRRFLAWSCAAFLLVAGRSAQAVPILQLYVEGGTYDSLSETWTIDTTGTFRLWAIGNTGAESLIQSVKLSAVYDTGLTPTITLMGSQVTGVPYSSFTDPSLAVDASYIRTVSDGSTPTLGDGSSLPPHGEYGAGRTWQEFALGNFTLTDSPLADFNGASTLPTSLQANKAQINVYDVEITGLSESATIHFDLYNSIWALKNGELKVRSINAPLSHDGEATVDPPVIVTEEVPEPASMALLAAGTLTTMGARAIRRRRSSTDAA